ncbi:MULTISPECIES: class I SAM-dependent methyltransferase [unclassified Streptomyces]|uniref:class I SAM-dependent methyltransferase n=1 Tax=unclassified Streptomyces TaxID=2593676 RepID=UPI00277D2446|nr:class I SAM-dependent methyltransferase [Streptomyces sp. V1I6]MDQ0844302.1 SAM-dependent methyltransferase [Streptomyces sp. V1I6]
MSASTLHVDPSNAEQARAWDGDEGAYWAAHADDFDRAVHAYQRPFLDAAKLQRGERVLDIGCGNGLTSRAAARLTVGGPVLGIDLSAAMLRAARQETEREGLDSVRYEQGDAQTYPFPAGAFDVAVSRNGCMFFAEPVTAFRNIARALRPGGRLALLVWQEPERNEWFSSFLGAVAVGRELPLPPPGAPGPFSMADPDVVGDVLVAAGFDSPHFDGRALPMNLGRDAEHARRFVSGMLEWALEGLDAQDRERALRSLGADIEGHLTPEGVRYESAAWIVTATKP